MCLYLVVNPKKKEYVDSELARRRVSKFYWWVAIRSQAWGLKSYCMNFDSFKIVDSRFLNPPQVFTGLVS